LASGTNEIVQHRMRRDEEGRAVAARERHLVRVYRHRPVRERLQAVPCRVAAGQHRDDAGGSGRRGHIDVGDPRMPMRRAKEIEISLARKVRVVGEMAGAGQEPRVLAPTHWFADPLRRDLFA
jgi:hypothetical protein